MVEEALDEARRVEGTNWWIAPAGRRRCASSAEVTVPEVTSTPNPRATDTLDQRDQREHLADARAVYPHQRALRARHLGKAAALGDALRVLLAALEPVREQQRRERRAHGGEPAIGAQRHRQPVRHGAHSGDRRSRGRGGSRW